jgi:hypothetical protein
MFPFPHRHTCGMSPRPQVSSPSLPRSVWYAREMLIYLDMCCLKRPFDDQSQPRIRLESEAVLALLSAESEAIRFARSPALWLENTRNPLPVRAARLARWLEPVDAAGDSAALEQRTRLLMQMGFGNFDALHVASAEATAADVFSTCDDRLLKAAMNVRDALRVRVVGVVELATEVLA